MFQKYGLGYMLFVVVLFFLFLVLKLKKKKKILESALIISHCTEYSALSLMVSPAVVWGLLGFFVFVLCPLPQFEMISKAPDLKKKRGKKKKSPVKSVYC